MHKQVTYKNFQTYPLSFQQAYLSTKLSTKFIEADENEKSHFAENADQLRQEGKSLGVKPLLGDKPLTVITPRKSWPEEDDSFNKVWQELQADLVTQSSKGKQIIAEHSDHMINLEQPEIIVQAVHEMVNELRNK